MKREIKFRGKRYDDEWVYGGITIPNGVPCIITYGDVCRSEHQVIPSTVGQYTGLKDKNGKEIYEGDIVEYCIHGDTEITEILFKKGCFGIICEEEFFDMVTFLEEAGQIEVIGNIHDNPELLEGAK